MYLVFRVTQTDEKVTRRVRQHAGWQSVRYQGKRYQVFGWVRNDVFIDLDNPIKGRKS